ncbi:hypothetical protein Nepgr_016993 [Nepenthes gracilis]|uniref:gibberellin 3beta-dioxygenase n=1 Tax=Nepenthes gracilis TaxID=150966 RepID=A0AAD3SRK0_NEPGR|nr:hypothetical protein Nepgr_016993 [Nepenthes gracilis]
MASELSDTLKSLPSHHFQDFYTLKELPESHAWKPVDDDLCPFGHHDMVAEQVPVVDLSDPTAERLIEHACRTWGVFQIINHGIPTRLLDDIESACQRLFSLPMHRKLRAAREPDGTAGYGPAVISSFFPKKLWSEGFTIFGSPLEHARQLWPNDYMKFCDIIGEYKKEMKQLAQKLTWLMLSPLGITQEDVKWAGPEGEFEGASAALQLNSYPTCPDPNRAMGLAAHTDSTLITILFQNNIAGLQVLREGFGWVTVSPIPRGLTINVGDMLHIMSNGLYPSVLHRATVNLTRHRLSVAYLFGPPWEAHVSPISKVVDSDHPPLYRAVTLREYREMRAEHFDKALSLVRLRAPN